MIASPQVYLLRSLCIVFLSFVSFTHLWAEEVVELPDVVVTEQDSDESEAKQTSAKTDLNREALSRGNKADLNAVLNGLSSVAIGQVGPGTTSKLIIRGAVGGSGLVNFDGVPLFSNFTGYFPLSRFPLDFLDKVNVSRGFNGEQNSSRTLGGSVNLYSRKIPHGKAFLHSEAGSYGTLRNNLGGGIHNQFGDLTFAGGRTDIFEGISQAGPQNGGVERDSSQMTQGMLNWNKHFSKVSLDSSAYFVETRDAYDGPGMFSNGKKGWKDDLNGLLNEQTWVAQGRASYQVLNNWESALKMGYTQDKQTGRIGTLPHCCSMDLTSQLWLGNWENTHQFAINKHSKDALKLIWGVDTQHQQGDSVDNKSKAHTLTTHLISPLARTEWGLGDWLGGAEVRYDHYDVYGDHTVFNANVGWRFYTDMLLWVKGGTGYRAPAVNERLHPLFGNPLLVPESNAGAELGWRWQFTQQSELSLSTYIQHYKNLIFLAQQPSGSIKSANAPQAHVWGTELQARHRWNEYWASGISYSYMEAKDPQTGLYIPGRPNDQGQFWTECRLIAPVTVRVDLSYRDANWNDVSNHLQVQAATHLNANINYKVNNNLALYVRGDNLNDDRTPDLYGFNYMGIAFYGGMHVDY